MAKKRIKSSILAKQSNGSIQLTFPIPFSEIEKIKQEIALKEAPNITVSGFRKGKAPISKVREAISEEALGEKALSNILPEKFNKAIKEHNLRPVLFPKFELVENKENKPWTVRAITCEAPKITLGDYKKAVKEAIIKGAVKNKKLSKLDKENLAVSSLADSIKFKLPEILVLEEVNARLSTLLDRLEKLGLSLDNYLNSINKTPESLREEYKKQSEANIKLDMILTEIANKEKVSLKKR